MDWLTIIIVAVLVLISTVIQVTAANRQGDKVSASIQQVRVALDGRMTELLASTASASRMEGADQERRENRERERQVP